MNRPRCLTTEQDTLQKWKCSPANDLNSVTSEECISSITHYLKLLVHLTFSELKKFPTNQTNGIFTPCTDTAPVTRSLITLSYCYPSPELATRLTLASQSDTESRTQRRPRSHLILARILSRPSPPSCEFSLFSSIGETFPSLCLSVVIANC